MDANLPPTAIPPARPRTGLAIAALVLGVLALFSSILVVGAFLGLMAIVLGAIHIAKRKGPNGMAWTGIGLSILSILLSAGLGILYLKGIKAGFSAVQQEWAQPKPAGTVDSEFSGWIGQQAPDITVTALNGKSYTLSELNGRRVVLDFWATWCPPCRQELPHFIQLAEENSTDDLLLIGISSEDEQTLKAFVAEEGVNYPIVSEADLPEPFNSIAAIPTTFFIDRNGIIQNVIVGYHDYEHLAELALAEDYDGEMTDAPVVEP